MEPILEKDNEKREDTLVKENESSRSDMMEREVSS